jgi:WD40 repeat protein
MPKFLLHILGVAAISFCVGLVHGQSPGGRASRSKDLYGDSLPEGALARCGTNRFRFDDWATQIVFAPNSKILAVLLQDGTVCLADAATGQELHRFRGTDDDPVSWVSFSGDSRVLAALSRWDRIELWDTATGRLVHRLIPSGTVISRIALSPDGTSLIAVELSDDESVLQVWDIATGKRMHSLCDQVSPLAIAYSPDGKQVAALLGEHIGIWDPASGLMTRLIASNIPDDAQQVHSFVYSPDCKHLALTCFHPSLGETKCHVWELAAGTRLCDLEGAPFEISEPFLPDGKTLVTLGSDGTIQWWDVTTGKQVRRDTRIENKGNCLAQSPDGKLLASGGIAGAVRFWDIATGQPAGLQAAHREPVTSVTVSRDGQLLSTLGRDGTVRVWKSTTGKQVLVIPSEIASFVSAVCFTIDSKGLIMAGANRTICIWDLEKNRLQRRIEGTDSPVEQLALSPEGKSLGTRTASGAVSLVDLLTGKEIRRFASQESTIGALSFRSDGRAIFSLSTEYSGVFEAAKGIHAWDTVSGKEIHAIDVPHESGPPFAFSADGQKIAARGEYGICIYDLSTGRILQELTDDRWGSESDIFVSALAFAPDGKTLAAGSSDGSITVWELATCGIRLDLNGHRGPIHALAWTTDCKLLVSASADTTALVWEVIGLMGNAGGQKEPLFNKKLEALWSQLAMGNAAVSYQAMCELSASPGDTIPFIECRLSPARIPAPGRITQLVTDLDNEEYAARRAATVELGRVAGLAEPALHEGLNGQPSSELRRRIEGLLAKIECRSSGETLRELRVVEFLERIGAREAREFLQEFAKGAPAARLTREAKASLLRLEKR